MAGEGLMADRQSVQTIKADRSQMVGTELLFGYGQPGCPNHDYLQLTFREGCMTALISGE